MKISTKGRYALRLMLDLAIHNTGEYISIKDIANRNDISAKYLEQIITQLNRAGFVQSVRGAQGGYMLTKKPSEYTVGMIVRVMEGEIAPVTCLQDDFDSCDALDYCVTREVWEKVKLAIEDVLDNITLEQLVLRYKEKTPPDYSI